MCQQHIHHEARRGGSAHSLAVGRTELPIGKRGRTVPSPGPWGKCEGLTYRGQKCNILYHHIVVQESLSFIKEAPLLLGEMDGHIFKGHMALPKLEEFGS